MIFTIILAVAVGASFAKVQPMIRDVLARVQISMSEREEMLVSFALCLAALAIVLSFLGVRPYPSALLISAAVGAAYKPLLARITGGR